MRPSASAEGKLDKVGRIMMSSEFNKEFDIIAEQIHELLRHFWSSADGIKRTRILVALIKKRSDIEAFMGKVSGMWTPSLKALVNAIDCAEKVARRIGE